MLYYFFLSYPNYNVFWYQNFSPCKAFSMFVVYKNEGEILNWLVLLEIQEKYSMMRRNMTLIIPAVSFQEAEEKPKKYWKGYEKENVRQRIIPMIIGQEMQLDNFLEISIPNNPYLDASWINKYQMCVKYFKENGNLLIPARYVIDGVRLGQWIGWQRQNYKRE